MGDWVVWCDLEDAMGILTHELEGAPPGSLCRANVMELRKACSDYLKRANG